MKKYGVTKDIPCVFIDALHAEEDEEGYEEEIKRFHEEMDKVKNHLLQNKNISCEGIDDVRSLLKVTMKDLEDSKDRMEKITQELTTYKKQISDLKKSIGK